jgi:hypothetical protein
MEAVLKWSIGNVMDTFESRVKSNRLFMHWNYPDVKKYSRYSLQTWHTCLDVNEKKYGRYRGKLRYI